MNERTFTAFQYSTPSLGYLLKTSRRSLLSNSVNTIELFPSQLMFKAIKNKPG